MLRLHFQRTSILVSWKKRDNNKNQQLTNIFDNVQETIIYQSTFSFLESSKTMTVSDSRASWISLKVIVAKKASKYKSFIFSIPIYVFLNTFLLSRRSISQSSFFNFYTNWFFLNFESHLIIQSPIKKCSVRFFPFICFYGRHIFLKGNVKN